jgi:hypothetical protein
MEEQIKVLNIDPFKLVSNFSRFSSNYGGSGIFVRKDLHTKEVNYLKEIGSDKVFELSVVELLDFNVTLACIYRSPDADFYEFLNKLELVICKGNSKGK